MGSISPGRIVDHGAWFSYMPLKSRFARLALQRAAAFSKTGSQIASKIAAAFECSFPPKADTP
jgi:hypothetical protein